MSKFKQTIIGLTNTDIEDAKASSVGLKDEAAKKRGLIDVLGARGAMNLFFENKFEVNNLYSMYSIQNVLNHLDIADIYHENFKFDVRIIFDEQEIFIPRAHFNYGILPDLYLIFKLEKDLSSMEFLGYIEPQNVNKELKNNEFYFVEKSQLLLPPTLGNQLKKLTPKSTDPSTEAELERAKGLFSALVDSEISDMDKQFLLNQLSKNFSLRESFVEFENFEMISKNLVKEESFEIEKNEAPIEEFQNTNEDEVKDVEEVDIINIDEFDFDFEEEESAQETPTMLEEKVEDEIKDGIEDEKEIVAKIEEKITEEEIEDAPTQRILPDLSLLKDIQKAHGLDEKIDSASTQKTEEKDLLQTLFKTEGIDKESMDFAQFDWSRLKTPENRKKIIIAASIAGIMLVGTIGGINVINHKNAEKLALEAPLPTPNPSINQDGTSPDEMNPEMNPGMDQGVMDPELQKQQSNPQVQGDMGKSLYNALSDNNVGGSTNISKIAWEVPEDLAYNDAFRKYLQTLGKNLKLTLENDLLLTADIAYSPKMIIDLKISKNGSVDASNIVVSSASKQIDEIVLRTVKEAVTYLKPPASEINSPYFNATLIINF